jgi:hypothetical protein
MIQSNNPSIQFFYYNSIYFYLLIPTSYLLPPTFHIILTLLFISYSIYIMFRRIQNTVDSLRGNRNGISPSADRFLDEHGDEPIQQLILSRNVISPLITSTLNNLSTNFKRRIITILYII